LSLSLFITQFLTGLSGASSLFLVAAGLTVIFGVTRVVNFSHGSLYMLGAYVGWTILGHLPGGFGWFVLGVLLTAVAVGVLGVLIELLVLRRLYRAPELFQLLATFGVVLMVQDVVQKIWGPNDLTLTRPDWMRAAVTIAGQPFPLYDLEMIFLGPVVLAALWLLFSRTRWGWLVRAATQDRQMVAALGVRAPLLFTAVFALGAALAGLAGAVSLPDGSANSGLDLSVIVMAFVVVVVGGMGSVTGAYLASLIIALLQVFGTILIPQFTLITVFVVMALVLVLRPNGLLGRAAAPARGPGEAVTLVAGAPRILLVLASLALLAAIIAPLFAGLYLLAVLTDALIAALFAASLHFIMGPGGMASFGHAAWFGIGAYAAALASQNLGVPMLGALALALLLAGAIAALAGLFLVRLAGVYLAMLTLAFAQIIWAVALQADDFTGGDNGILGIWPPDWAASPSVLYWFTLGTCLGAVLLLRRILFAPAGYALRAARDSELRAASIGIPVTLIRLAGFAIAGAMAGLAGGLFVFVKGSVFPSYISIPHSVDALVMVLLGGVQTVAGPLIGALIYTGLYDGLESSLSFWRFALGAAIILLVMLFPEGVAGAVQKYWRARG
jgi:branched-chain amino acid transport system permease protein